MKKLLFLILLSSFSFANIYSQGIENNASEHNTQKIIVKKKKGGKETIIIKERIKNGKEDNIKEFEINDEDDAIFLEDGAQWNFTPQDGMDNPISSPNKAVLGIMIESAGGNNGASITEVMESGAAAKAGLKAGDIIQKVNDKTISDVPSLMESLSKASPGDKVSLVYMRNAELHKIDLTLQERSTMKYSTTCLPHDKEYLIHCDPYSKKKIIIKERRNKNQDQQGNMIKQNIKNGDQSLELSFLTSHPNPSTGQLTINFKGEKSPVIIQIIGLDGKEYFSDKIENFDGTYNKEINITDAKGTLVISVKQGDKIISEKIMVE